MSDTSVKSPKTYYNSTAKIIISVTKVKEFLWRSVRYTAYLIKLNVLWNLEVVGKAHSYENVEDSVKMT